MPTSENKKHVCEACILLFLKYYSHCDEHLFLSALDLQYLSTQNGRNCKENTYST